MKNKRYKNILTEKVVSCYSLGKSICIDRIREMMDDGEDVDFNDLPPKNEIVEMGFNYLNDNESYMEIVD